MISSKEIRKNDYFIEWKENKGISEKNTYSYANKLKTYLTWRKKTIKDLLQSKNEEQYLEEFREHYKGLDKEQYGYVIITAVRAFLRFHNVEVNESYQGKIIWYYENDPYMEKFIKGKRAKGTKKMYNIALSHYCNWIGKNPTELINENIPLPELKERLIDFRDFLDNENDKSKAYLWRIVMIIANFYKKFKDLTIIFEDSDKPRIVKRLQVQVQGEMITKEELRKLLEVSDIRDKAIIISLFESGLNPVDLVSISYSQVKNFLNIDDPDNTLECAVFKHIRQKYPIEHFAVLGKQSLYYISKFLQQRKLGLFGEKENISVLDSKIFVTKSIPHTPLTTSSIYQILTTACKKANIRKIIPKDFRNSFSTKLKQSGMDYLDREMFMGHSLGMSGHYEISNDEHYTKEYLKIYNVSFDLSYSNEKVLSLEEENRDLKIRVGRMEKGYQKLIHSLKTGKPIDDDSELFEDLDNFAYGYDK